MATTQRTTACMYGFAAIIALLVLLLTPSHASAEVRFCPTGSGAGECNGSSLPLAVNTTSGRIYVADSANNRVDVFNSDGSFVKAFGWGVADGVSQQLQSCTTSCFAGIPGSGAGQFSFSVPQGGIAVDNHPTSESVGDVYVVDTRNHRVEKFDSEGNFLLQFGEEGTGDGQLNEFSGTHPLAVGPDGRVFVGDNEITEERPGTEPGTEIWTLSSRVEVFSPAGAFVKAVSVLNVEALRAPGVIPSTQGPRGVAVDSEGHIYVIFEGSGKLAKFSEDGALIFEKETETGASPSLDQSGNLFVGEQERRVNRDRFTVITEYDPSGQILRRFGYRQTTAMGGLAAFHSATGDVFGSENGGGGLSKPSGRIAYLALPPPGPIAVPPSVEAGPVGNTKATLKAEINPEGEETTYHFQYVDQQGFENGGFSNPDTVTTPESTSVGSDFELHQAEAVIGCQNPPTGSCLTPETTYHFRVVATNSEGSSEEAGTFTTRMPAEVEATWALEVTRDGAQLRGQANPLGIPTSGHFQYVDDATFQRSGFAEAVNTPSLDFGSGEAGVARGASLQGLAPGTAYHYRLVLEDPLLAEPLTSEAHVLTTFRAPTVEACPNQAFRSGASAELPDCRAYEMVSPIDKGGGDIIGLLDNGGDQSTLDQATPDGDKLTYSTYRAFGDAPSAPISSQYLATRAADGWSSRGISPPHGEIFLEPTLALNNQFKAFSPDLCRAWLLQESEPVLAPKAVKGYANLYEQSLCGEQAYTALTIVKPPFANPAKYVPELQGISADGSHIVFGAHDKLTKDAPELSEGNKLLYELPAPGRALRFVCVLPDGSAVASACTAGTKADDKENGRDEALAGAVSDDGSKIYWSDGQGKLYLRVNGKEPTVAVSGGPAEFWGAAADGSRAVFTTGKFEAGEASLFEYDVAEGAASPIAGEVSGVVGINEDASRIYFVSDEDLTAGQANSAGREAAAGQPNLYLFEGHEGASGTFTFVAGLSAGDIRFFTQASLVNPKPDNHLAQVSADGSALAFASTASPTGYDNVDASSGERDTEVYLYDATAKRLVCASCNPSGERPSGALTVFGAGHAAYWAAARIPGSQTQLYVMPRVLSEDGRRLFFESADALSPTDTNGATDVYEWEAPGKGGCGEQSASFSPQDGGCVSLVSSGESPTVSEIVGTNPSGHDVFFTTAAGLLPQDPGLIDIYDARVEGGFPQPIEAAACEGEACQGPISPPNDPTPASSSFEGAGNVHETAAKPAKCPKGKVRKKGRCVQKHHKHHRRKHAKLAHKKHHKKRARQRRRGAGRTRRAGR